MFCRRAHYHKLCFTSWEIKGDKSTVRCLQSPSRQKQNSHTRLPLHHHHHLSPLTLLDAPHKDKRKSKLPPGFLELPVPQSSNKITNQFRAQYISLHFRQYLSPEHRLWRYPQKISALSSGHLPIKAKKQYIIVQALFFLFLWLTLIIFLVISTS